MEAFTDIDELLTLQGAEEKFARRVLDSDLGIIKKAAIVIDKGVIKWIGSTNKIPRVFKKLKRQSLKGMTVLPAFVEPHTHLVFAGDRKNEFEMRVRGMSYQQIAERGGGIRSTVQATRRASDKLLLNLAQERVDNFVRQGVTTIESKSGYGLDLKSEIKILSVSKKLKNARIVTTYLGPHAVPVEHKNSSEYMDEVIHKHLPQVAKLKLASRGDIFVEKGYFSIADAESFIRAIKNLGWDLAIHADQLSDAGAVELGVRVGARSVDHVLQTRDEDLKSLASSETTAVLLPAADLYLNTSYPQARKILDGGGRVALSTDFNPGSSPTQDISLVGVLARLEMKMTLPEVIVAYTLGGAYALGLQDRIGSLSVGKSADFIAIGSSYRDLFYQTGLNSIRHVWRDGKKLKIT